MIPWYTRAMQEELRTTIALAVQELFGEATDVELARPEPQFGDYATNVALQIAKQVGKNPREIAEAIAGSVRHRISPIRSIDVAGPGFLNITLTDEALYAAAKQDETKPLAGKRVLVEYSDPNPFKPLHAGHLYTTLVGDTIARLVERAGAETIRLNYNGDVGRHVGISMWSIVQYLGGELPEKLAEVSEADRPAWLGARYVEGTTAFEDDESVKHDILACNKRVYEVHEQDDHESPFAQIYWTCRQWSYDYFPELYRQLQVVPFDRFIPESEVTPLGVATVREQLQQGVYTESNGAVVFDGAPHGLHTRVFINSEGLPTYETKDVGLSLTKWQDYQFDQSIIITANEQEQYMQVVLKSIEQFAPEPARRTRHITHGVVKLAGGVKMSSRKGNIVTALEILEAAREAGQQSQAKVTEENMLAAVKYAFAKNRIGGDIAYDPVESIALEGNSGPYLQYAHARARSILSRHSGLDPESHSQIAEILKRVQDETGGEVVLQPDERLLVRKLTEYPEVIAKATTELMPHHICTYLYELAQEFNRFYEKNRVIGDDREALRLGLVETYAKTLKTGLQLLGIQAPERM